MHKYLLVNLDTCFTNGDGEKTIQPKWLNKYFNHILVSPYNFDETMDKLLTMGFKRGVGGKKKGKEIDSTFGMTLLPFEQILSKERKRLPTLQFKKIAKEWLNV
tara:strand:- start:154 stop:465 length:312 start_codon:yes stop_codon:yes gene_type:complete